MKPGSPVAVSSSSVCRSSWRCRRRPRPTPSRSRTASGAAWIVILRSDAVAAISTASTPSAISSPALTPTMPTPSTRSVPGSMISLVSPSLRSTVVARPEAPQGNFATSIAMPRSCASASVRPHQAISGSVKTTAGIAAGSNATLCPAMCSTAILRFVGRLVREHRLAGDVADGVDVRHGRAALRVDGDEAARRHLDAGGLDARDVAVGLAADRHEHLVEHLRLRLDVAFEGDVHAVGLLHHADDLRARQHLLADGLDAPPEHVDEVAVGARQQPVEHLDDGDLRAEGRVDRAQFEADVAAADDEQARRDPLASRARRSSRAGARG